jgi:hypothetical protein
MLLAIIHDACSSEDRVCFVHTLAQLESVLLKDTDVEEGEADWEIVEWNINPDVTPDKFVWDACRLHHTRDGEPEYVSIRPIELGEVVGI